MKELKDVSDELFDARRRINDLTDKSDEEIAQIDRLKTDFTRAQHEADKAQSDLKDCKLGKGLDENVEGKIKALESIDRKRAKDVKRMNAALTDMATKYLKLTFGEKIPHLLIRTDQGDMIAEFPPMGIMPVAVTYFLELVNAGFWNGKSFFRAESHVIQASGVSKDGKSHEYSKSIPFQEYASEFPHVKYTLGIAGRPGGPDFYVSMRDNTKIHGPGGQTPYYDGNPDSDPCFARLVSGQSVADKIQGLPYNSKDGMHFLKENVEIIEIRLIQAQEWRS